MMRDVKTPTQNENPQGQYKIIFWGQPEDGVGRKLLAERFIALFRLRDPSQARRFFSGRMVVLKSGLSEAQARTFAQALRDIGGVCRIERTQAVQLDGELARRRRPSFMEPGVSSDQMSLAPLEQERPLPEGARDVSGREPNRKSVFEARDVSGGF